MKTGKFLIVTWEGGGNVPPAIALGARLARAGHTASLLGPRSMEERALVAGLEFNELRSHAPWPEDESIDAHFDRLDAALNGPDVARDVVDVVQAESPDVLVVDCMMGAASAAAELMHVPTAFLVHVLFQPFATAWGGFVVNESKARAALGLGDDTPTMDEILSRMKLILACTPKEFDFPGAPPGLPAHYVGPIFEPDIPKTDWARPWQEGDTRPIALVSLSSTLQGQDVALPPILGAVGGLPLRGLLTLGNVVGAESLTVPPNVVAVDYLPHSAVLGETNVVISHGGLSTVMAALAYGVPLVCIPQGRDQSFNAERVEACGAGVNLPQDSEPAAIAEAVMKVLEDPSYTASSRSMASVIAGLGGGALAVSLLEELL